MMRCRLAFLDGSLVHVSNAATEQEAGMGYRELNAVDELLRNSALDLGGEVKEQRRIFEEMIGAAPLPADVIATAGSLGGVPVVTVDIAGAGADEAVLYFHGGAYAVGTAASSAGLASGLGRHAGIRVVSVDYRLAPEHPFPAALEDGVAAYRALLDGGLAPARVAIAGESAGAGLAAATLAALKSQGLAQPAAAVLMSPWADLTLTGASVTGKAAADPALTRAGLARRARDYAGGHDLADARISPVFGDLAGLPPLLIQAGSHEILLDDAIRLAARAATADVPVTLEVTAGAPHVFQGFAAILPEGDAALARAGAFLRSQLRATALL
jgi:monoterpene epsilon-lactone hydrolase